MIYSYNCPDLPQIESVYSVIRKTVWKIADPYNIIIFIKSGQCEIQLDNHIYRLAAGDLFYMPANTLYTRKPFNNEFCEIFYIHFTLPCAGVEYENSDAFAKVLLKQNPEFFSAGRDHRFLLPSKTSFKTDADAVYRKILDIRKYYNGDNAFDTQTAVFSLCTLLSVVSNKYMSYILTKRSETEYISYPDALKKALSYIRDHYTEPISLTDLCNVAFVSKQMLIRHFNNTFGKSPTVYISEYKINRIKPLLMRYPNMSIKEICSEFGFEDQCYFSRVFKKYTGESPTEYRERVKNFNETKHLSEN